MKSVRELNREQLIELKQKYLATLDDEGKFNEKIYGEPDLDKQGIHLSTMELANADNLVKDETIFEEYGDTVFSEDDFSYKGGF